MSKDRKFNTQVLGHNTWEYSSTQINLKLPVKSKDFCWDVIFLLLPLINLISNMMTSLDILTIDTHITGSCCRTQTV